MICIAEEQEVTVPRSEFDSLRRNASLWEKNRCRMKESGRVRPVNSGINLEFTEYNKVLNLIGKVSDLVVKGWSVGMPPAEYLALRSAYIDYHDFVHDMQKQYNKGNQSTSTE